MSILPEVRISLEEDFTAVRKIRNGLFAFKEKAMDETQIQLKKQ